VQLSRQWRGLPVLEYRALESGGQGALPERSQLICATFAENSMSISLRVGGGEGVDCHFSFEFADFMGGFLGLASRVVRAVQV
jgi:hypothetical protein